MPQSSKYQSPLTPIIVLLGGPGSGKGTHGQALATALGYEHLSSGEHFRDHISRETPLGLRAAEFIKKGQLVPDELATDLVRGMLDNCSSVRGFVLDGFPRSLEQAKALEEIASTLACSIAQTLYLAVADDETVRRLSGRLTCRECGRTFHEASNPPQQSGVCDACGKELFRRADDEPSTIRQRIGVFRETIGPLLDFYRESGCLVEVPAEGPVQVVSARVIAKSKGA